MAREPKPLELLNRDHNWRMGQLRRLYVALDILRDARNREVAKLTIDAEMQEETKTFQEARVNLLNQKAE